MGTTAGMMHMVKRLEGRLTTGRVTDWLENTDQGRVLHVFRGVLNLMNEHGEIISIVNPVLGAGPFAVVLERGIDFQAYVTVESVVEIEPEKIYCDELEIDLADAKQWHAQPEWQALHAGEPQRFLWLYHVIENVLLQEAPEESMAQVLFSQQLGAGQSRFFDRAFEGVTMVRRGIGGDDKYALQQGTKQLAGLGIGLTPAGDDFLIGVMHGLWLTRSLSEAKRMSNTMDTVARERTNSISRAWLKAAAAGETGEPWHNLLSGFKQDDQAKVEQAIYQILPTGHTSGADALAGFVMVLALAGAV